MFRVLFTAMAFSAAVSASTAFRAHDPRVPRPCGELIDVTADTTTAADGPFAKAYLRWRVGTGPRYPASLRNGHPDGEVVATYVVDTLGHVMRNTAQITAESNRAFGQAVCTFLANATVIPVTLDGRKRTMRVLDAHFKFRFGEP